MPRVKVPFEKLSLPLKIHNVTSPKFVYCILTPTKILSAYRINGILKNNRIINRKVIVLGIWGLRKRARQNNNNYPGYASFGPPCPRACIQIPNNTVAFCRKCVRAFLFPEIL